jgi:HEAT repeat protein
MVSKELDLVTVNLDPAKEDRLLSAFASIGPKAVDRSIQLLTDPKRRERAMRVLAKIGPDAAPAVPSLVGLLKDTDPAVKQEALYTLASIGPKAAEGVEPITALLKDPDRDVKLTSHYALGKIGPAAKSALPALKGEMTSDDEMVKVTAVWAMLKIDPQNQEIAAMAIPLMADVMDHPYDFIQVEAAMSLGELGPAAASAIPALEAALRDNSPAVRSAAADAIRKIKGEAAPK